MARAVRPAHLSSVWASRFEPMLASRPLASRPLVLLLDFDGTLAPMASVPGKAKLPVGTRRLLQALNRCPRVCLGLVSGRQITSLVECVGVRGLIYAGNHGLELRGRGHTFRHPAALRARPTLLRLVRRLRRDLAHTPNVWIQWKGLSCSIHWRLVPASARPAMHRIIREVVREDARRGRVRVTAGKQVTELRPPVQWNKGSIVSWLLGRTASRGFRNPLVVYAGDDRTDEDAFRGVNRAGGVSIFVGPPETTTAARYRLRDPREVAAWLRRVSRVVRRECRRER